jgi:hypothetical protein
MIPYEDDPSLHAAQPAPPQLDDGFSPPADQAGRTAVTPVPDAVDPALWAKSEF